MYGKAVIFIDELTDYLFFDTIFPILNFPFKIFILTFFEV